MTKPIIAILGAGSWGTAMAIHIANQGFKVMLWGHNPQHMQLMAASHCNQKYLPDYIFPESLTPSADINACIKQADYVMIAVPSHAFTEVLAQIEDPINGLVWITKGVDPKTNQLLSALVSEKYGEDFPKAILSGPSFAKEVARFLPTAITLAGNNHDFLKKVHKIVHHDNIRVYLSDDLIGVQLCGAVKNVLAIACGISDGLGYGANAKAALITRGLAEMSRLGLKLGARQDTFIGLAGVGDLVLTCTDNQSRNRRFGLLLGEGYSQINAEKAIGQVVEGKHNAAQVCQIAKSKNVEMPICEQVHAILINKTNPKNAVHQLMTRPAKEE